MMSGQNPHLGDMCHNQMSMCCPTPLLGLDIDRCITKVESGKCRRVTVAIDIIVMLCHKSVGKRVCDVLPAVSTVMQISRW